MDVKRLYVLHPHPVRGLKDCTEPVRFRLVRSHEAERLGIHRYDVAKIAAHDPGRFAQLGSGRYDFHRLVVVVGEFELSLECAAIGVGIASILAKARESGFLPGKIVPTKPSERAIVLDCARLPECVRSAGQSFLPNEIADFAFGLAQNFSKFYADCPVLTADTESERSSRLGLCALTYAVLAKSLWLLNIEVPQRM
jgi:arginyl-tRNA synthetase